MRMGGEGLNPKVIGLVVFDGMRMLDFAGSAEAFGAALIPTGFTPYRAYRVVTIAPTRNPCAADSGVTITPQETFDTAPELDTLILPGASSFEVQKIKPNLLSWLKYRVPTTRRIAALSSAIYPLAETGFLDGRQTTTHWRFAKDIASRFPKLKLTQNSLFIKDGPFFTAAGGSASIDFSLSLIEEDYGRRIALGLARELIVYMKRPGSEGQYSESLQFQTKASDRFSDIPAWILCNLHENLSVEVLAQRACLCPRHFARLFKGTFGRTPSEFVEDARLKEAERRLAIPRNSIGSIAASLGFRSHFAFCRAFERRLGMTPSQYRAGLAAPALRIAKFAPRSATVREREPAIQLHGT
jgi:transcriptional regulator GlxA family with amidase domain